MLTRRHIIITVFLLSTLEFTFGQECCLTRVQYEVKFHKDLGNVTDVGIPYSEWYDKDDTSFVFRPVNKNSKYLTTYLGWCAHVDTIIKDRFLSAEYCLIKLRTQSTDGNILTKDFKIPIDSLSIRRSKDFAILVKIPLLK